MANLHGKLTLRFEPPVSDDRIEEIHKTLVATNHKADTSEAGSSEKLWFLPEGTTEEDGLCTSYSVEFEGLAEDRMDEWLRGWEQQFGCRATVEAHPMTDPDNPPHEELELEPTREQRAMYYALGFIREAQHAAERSGDEELKWAVSDQGGNELQWAVEEYIKRDHPTWDINAIDAAFHDWYEESEQVALAKEHFDKMMLRAGKTEDSGGLEGVTVPVVFLRKVIGVLEHYQETVKRDGGPFARCMSEVIHDWSRDVERCSRRRGGRR